MLIDITGHAYVVLTPHNQLLRMNLTQFYFENKSQTNCNRNTVK